MIFGPKKMCARRKRRPMMRQFWNRRLMSFGRRAGDDVEVLRLAAEQQVAHAAADEVGGVIVAAEPLDDLGGVGIDPGSGLSAFAVRGTTPTPRNHRCSAISRDARAHSRRGHGRVGIVDRRPGAWASGRACSSRRVPRRRRGGVGFAAACRAFVGAACRVRACAGGRVGDGRTGLVRRSGGGGDRRLGRCSRREPLGPAAGSGAGAAAAGAAAGGVAAGGAAGAGAAGAVAADGGIGSIDGGAADGGAATGAATAGGLRLAAWPPPYCHQAQTPAPAIDRPPTNASKRLNAFERGGSTTCVCALTSNGVWNRAAGSAVGGGTTTAGRSASGNGCNARRRPVEELNGARRQLDVRRVRGVDVGQMDAAPEQRPAHGVRRNRHRLRRGRRAQAAADRRGALQRIHHVFQAGEPGVGARRRRAAERHRRAGVDLDRLRVEPGRLGRVRVDDDLRDARQRAGRLVERPQLLEHLGDLLVVDHGRAPSAARARRPRRSAAGGRRPRRCARRALHPPRRRERSFRPRGDFNGYRYKNTHRGLRRLMYAATR